MSTGGRPMLLIVAVATTALAGCTTPALGPSPSPADSRSTAEPRVPPPTAPAPEPSPTRPRWERATAVDGDTIRLATGLSVRVVGIDTPEVGDCGSDEATAMTAALIRDGVRLRRAKAEDRDHYGRLLRYVVTRRGDLGTLLLRRGLAIARYDATDGYGWHPLQDRYHRIDAGTPKQCPVAASRVAASAPRPLAGPLGTDCDPAYTGTCVPQVDEDLDCADISGAVQIVGTDRHRFDGDGDGLGCE